MALTLNEDQQLLAKSAHAFSQERSPVTRVRTLRDSNNPRGYELTMLREMAELGWTSIAFDESVGGMGLGMSSAVVVAEALGKQLAPEPLLGSLMLAGSILASHGSSSQRASWLAPAISGDKVLALAHLDAAGRYAPHHITTLAAKTSTGYLLNGVKQHVIDGYLADAYVVVARTPGESDTSDGLTLFVVPASTAGVTVTRLHRVDSRNAARVAFDGVLLDESSVIGTPNAGRPALAAALDRATVALCAEMLGGMTQAFAITLAHLKERRQFDVVIGTFQALQHRAAKLYIEIEMARSATMGAATALDDQSQDAPASVSVAKARCSDTYTLVTNEAVQILSGIGMTDEHDIGFYMKRARTAEQTLGDAAFHRDRYASLSGF